MAFDPRTQPHGTTRKNPKGAQSPLLWPPRRLRWPQIPTKMASTMVQYGLQDGQDASRTAKTASKSDKTTLKRMAKDDLKTAQDPLNTASRRPNSAPRYFQDA